jgi:hypothetical protein
MDTSYLPVFLYWQKNCWRKFLDLISVGVGYIGPLHKCRPRSIVPAKKLVKNVARQRRTGIEAEIALYLEGVWNCVWFTSTNKPCWNFWPLASASRSQLSFEVCIVASAIICSIWLSRDDLDFVKKIAGYSLGIFRVHFTKGPWPSTDEC